MERARFVDAVVSWSDEHTLQQSQAASESYSMKNDNKRHTQ